MPKVSWTRPQTVQSILLDYSYTEQEIQDVMEDLKGFKGFDQSYTSEDEFEIENYIDESLKKYFYETRNRNHYAFEKPDCGKHPEKWIPGKTFVICSRNISDKHFPYGKKVQVTNGTSSIQLTGIISSSIIITLGQQEREYMRFHFMQ